MLLKANKLVNHSRAFHISSTRRDIYKPFVEDVVGGLKGNKALSDVLTAVWENERVTAVCPNLIIRLTSLRGEVSKRVWSELGNNPDDIQILAVGTTAIPSHLPKYHKFLDNFWNKASHLSGQAKKGNSYAIGYDLLSKGSETSTSAVLNLFNHHFGFDKETLNMCKNSIAITCGGMRGLKDLADGSIMISKKDKTFHRFIQPDNSFGTWWNIIENPVQGDSSRREIHSIKTSPQNKLHLVADDVYEFYRNNKPHTHESWYITPVGNPSGTKMTPEQLKGVCEAIIKCNPNAYILLDSVYVRTLPEKDGVSLMKGVVSNKQILDKVIFLESFSKSHGLCRERLGCYFSTNNTLFTKLHASNITYSAGPGEHKDFQFQALGEMSNEDREGVASLHQFWRDERGGLVKFLLQPKYHHLFEPSQPHITSDDIDNTLGLYILLKLKEGVNAKQVFLETGALGVDTPLLSGKYIRFSVGTLTKPSYSKYLSRL
eukprot:TRINITY_DN5952_c0_g2_i1.p1 TRINITY_DN5952_c0_g2~~TRINITY_DN5952_c0_g2_i1.p1  ORF type:complete len:488 (-),score=68.44 TRINITY_DN5952_c0_g2_i1:98-1561(-)